MIPGYRRITDMVHAEGVPILAQINHNGGQSSGMFTRLPAWAPSAIADPLFREVPKAVEHEDIQQIIEGYATVADYTKQGGFDGIELQCSHSSIVRQFLSRNTNHRTDDYGGSLENRARLLREIIAAIRLKVGSGLCDERAPLRRRTDPRRHHDRRGGGAGAHSGEGRADRSDQHQHRHRHPDAVHDRSFDSIPPNYAMFIPSALRKAVGLPVIGVGRVKDPIQAERLLAEGHADLVGIVRAQIADPEFSRKARENLTDDIRLCLSCNQECVGRMGLNRWLGCIETPATGREKEYGIGTLQRVATPSGSSSWAVGLPA